MLHEFIADAKVVATENKRKYYQNLLSEIFQTNAVSFTNTFSKTSLIKKRLTMLHKTQTKKIKRLKFLIVLPLIGLMLFFVACTHNKDRDNATPKDSQEVKSETNDSMTGDEVNFEALDTPPLYPGCKDKEDKKNCMSRNIQKFITKHFNTDIYTEDIDSTDIIRIHTQFTIDPEGKVTDIKTETKSDQYSAFAKEAKRVVEKLPDMEPGKKDGKKVRTVYVLPIAFKAQAADAKEES